MSVILDALVKLEKAVGALEGAASHVESALSSAQPDMFTQGRAPGQGDGGIDPAVVAQKLDHAIERVEGVLSEGQGV